MRNRPPLFEKFLENSYIVDSPRFRVINDLIRFLKRRAAERALPAIETEEDILDFLSLQRCNTIMNGAVPMLHQRFKQYAKAVGRPSAVHLDRVGR